MTPGLENFARIAVEQIALALVAGSAIAACAWTLLRVTPRRDSASRFALWLAALLAIAALPVVGTVWRTPAHAAGSNSAIVTLSAEWATAIFALWAVIALFGLLRVAVGLWQIRQLRRACRQLAPEQIPAEVAAVLAQSAAGRRLRLCTSDRVRVPAAIGFGDPAIVVPDWLLAEMPAEEFQQVVVHELAHLERRDDWTNLAQKVVRALFFFHPVVWWIDSRLSLEREMACDDAVLARNQHPRQYAACLTRLAERTLGRRTAELAQAAVSRVRQTSLRVAQILSIRPKPGHAWTMASALLVLAAGISAASVRQAQQWIAVSDAPSSDLRAANIAGRVPGFIAPANSQTAASDSPTLVHAATMKIAPPATKAVSTVTPRTAPRTESPFRAEPSKNALLLFRNVRAPRPADADSSFFLTVFQESTTTHGTTVQMWHVTVWVADPAARQVPRKTT